MRIAWVRWHDAASFADSVPLKNLGKHPCELKEVGYLLKETKTHVVLGLERDTAESMTDARFVLSIPRENIREMRVVDERKAFPVSTRKKA